MSSLPAAIDKALYLNKIGEPSRVPLYCGFPARPQDILPKYLFLQKMFENNLHTYTTTINALVISILRSVCCPFEPTLTYIHHGTVGGCRRPMCCSNRPLVCRQQQHPHICILAEYKLYSVRIHFVYRRLFSIYCPVFQTDTPVFAVTRPRCFMGM